MKEKKNISFLLLPVTSFYICFDVANTGEKFIAKNKLGKLKLSRTDFPAKEWAS